MGYNRSARVGELKQRVAELEAENKRLKDGYQEQWDEFHRRLVDANHERDMALELLASLIKERRSG